MKSLVSWTQKFGSAQEMVLVFQGKPRRGTSSGGGVSVRSPTPSCRNVHGPECSLRKHSEGSEQLRVLLTRPPLSHRSHSLGKRADARAREAPQRSLSLDAGWGEGGHVSCSAKSWLQEDAITNGTLRATHSLSCLVVAAVTIHLKNKGTET